MKKIVSVFLLSVLAQLAVAAEEIEQLNAFTGAKLLEQGFYPSQEEMYPAGSVRRISGNFRYSAEFKASGSKAVNTWQIASLHSADQAFFELRQYWRQQGAHTLYWCEGRECGASNLWANTVFNNAQLYGPDDNQAYALMLLPEKKAQKISAIAIVLYAIKRGNGRSYVHQERVELSQLPKHVLPEPATLLKQLNKEGELQLAHLTEQPTKEWVNLLARSIKRNALLQVTLQGQYAGQWQAALREQGVPAQQLSIDTVNQQSGLVLKKR